MKINLMLVLICAVSCQDSELYRREWLSTQGGASCLDGTIPSIYVHEGTDRNKFLLFFDHGGFCQGFTLNETLANCYLWSLNNSGSTDNTSSTKSFNGKGILSPIEKENPDFYNWTKIFVTYCDGSAFLGNRNESYDYMERRLYFRGEINFEETIRYLETKYNFYNKDQIVIAGVETGGIAALAYSNYLMENTNSSQVLVLLDSSIFLLDFSSMMQNINMLEQMTPSLAKQISDKYSVPQLIKNCLAINQFDVEKCLNPISYIKFVKPRMMVIQSAYDFNEVANIINAQCLTSATPSSLRHCQFEEIDIINIYRSQMLNFLINLSKSQISVWSTSCAHHGFLNESSFTNQIYTAGGLTLSKAVSRFVQKPETVRTLINSENWLSNVTCKHKSCIVGKQFQLNLQEARIVIIKGESLMLQGCVSTLEKYSLQINTTQQQENEIRLINTAFGECDDMLVVFTRQAMKRSGSYSVVSTKQKQQLHLFNRKGKWELILILSRQRRSDRINQFTLEGFYTLHFPPFTLDFTSNGNLKIDVCRPIEQNYILTDDTLHFKVPESSFQKCTNVYSMYINQILFDNTFSLNHCKCWLETMVSSKISFSSNYTLIAKPIQETVIQNLIDPADLAIPPTDPAIPPTDPAIPPTDPQSIVGDYTLTLPDSTQVSISISQKIINIQGCSNVGSKYQTSWGNKILFVAFYRLGQAQCPSNYIDKLKQARQYVVRPGIGLTFLNLDGEELLTLKPKV